MRIFIALVVLCLSVRADGGFSWSITDRPSFQWTITEKGAATDSGGERPAMPDPEPVSEVRTGQCQCQSRGEGACYCLKTGNACHCPTRGPSTWELTEAGAPIRKVQKPKSPQLTASHQNSPQGYPVTLQSDGLFWWTEETGKRWWAPGTLKDGDVATGAGVSWEYRDGRMSRKGSVMAADIAPKGRWETYTVCHGTYCTTHKRWVPE